MRPFNLLQITDCHLGSQPGEKLLGLDTDQSLHDVLACAQENEQPDLVLATGDISNDGGVASYERFTQIVKQYFPSVPLAWLPGNHDDPENMDLVTELPIEAHMFVEGWNLIFLDSRIPMQEGGNLNAAELVRLESELQAHIDDPTMIFLHHQPVPVESAWVDEYVVKNSDEFFGIVDRYENIKAISWGHIHQEFLNSRQGVQLFATPSTCVQFMPKNDEFQVDRAMPGYRIYKLHRDGKIDSAVKRVENKSYTIDFASTGY